MATKPRSALYRSIQERAAYLGLHLRSWSPGDGVTRYRFLSGRTPAIERDYFAARQDYVLGTCLGSKDAESFLSGYAACHAEYAIDQDKD